MKKQIRTNEQIFYETLKSLFVGPAIEGKGGFATMYKVKEMYYQKFVDEIQKEVEKYGEFKEEIYGVPLYINKYSTHSETFTYTYLT